MFCYQCEQTSKGTGCIDLGVCGKDTTTGALQDLLVQAAKGVAVFAQSARRHGATDPEVDSEIVQALFTSVTNVNFDPTRLMLRIDQCIDMRNRAQALYEAACVRDGVEPNPVPETAAWMPGDSLEERLRQAEDLSIARRKERLGEDVVSLQELLLYGLKGTAAYVEHARVLGLGDDALAAGLAEGLELLTHEDATMDELVAMSLKTGALNLRAMELLDEANTTAYGHPEPTAVRIEPRAGKAILVSGHDLRDMEDLLKQTEGKGINVYTHGEMLPANAYPKLKAYKHLAGNYGGAWQDQAREFDAFPGAILMTTNCIQRPRESYKARIFTSGLVAWPGVHHIVDHDFTPVIDAALAAPGFAEDGGEKTITVGFAHNAVLGVADKVIDGVKSGAIRRFFLIGGCDGARPGRDYYAQLAEAVPDDCVILTLACGKYRFNKKEFGDIGGIPRLLDMGQCNDAYSAIKVAVALADAFGCGVNELPLSLILSWYEQKAVAILLTLLHLGVKNIRIGPTLPAFISPNVLKLLVENYNLMPISEASKDLQAILS